MDFVICLLRIGDKMKERYLARTVDSGGNKGLRRHGVFVRIDPPCYYCFHCRDPLSAVENEKLPHKRHESEKDRGNNGE